MSLNIFCFIQAWLINLCPSGILSPHREEEQSLDQFPAQTQSSCLQNTSKGIQICMQMYSLKKKTDLDHFSIFLENFVHFIFLAFHYILRSQSQLSCNKAKHGSLK